MNKTCVICFHSYPISMESILKEYKGTCTKCRKILMEEAPSESLYSGGVSTIEEGIKELEERIPDLFVGPTCSFNGECACTYKTGCKVMKNKDKNISK